MYPTLFELDIFGAQAAFGAYSVFVAVAVVSGMLVSWFYGRRRGLPPLRFGLFLVATVASIFIGARALHVALNPTVYTADPLRAFALKAEGFAMFGGIIIAIIVGVFLFRVLRLDLWEAADASVPGVATGLILVRVGCFLNGCCFGHVTDSPPGVMFPSASQPHIWQLVSGRIGLFDPPLAVHPAQLYEMAGTVLCLMLACVLARVAPAGVSFAAFFGAFSIVRWVNWEFFRVHPASFDGQPWLYDVIYGALLLVSCAVIFLRWRKPPQSDD